MENKLSETKRRNIRRAREFALKCISGKTNSYTVDDYYTLQLSKFLLLKESIIKKNPLTNTIYFNFTKSAQYLNSIKKIVNYIKSHGVVRNNNINVVIEPKEYETDEIKDIVLTFHKLRDAIAHGEYEIDSNREVIIIDNTDDDNLFEMSCEIPFSLLSEFTYSDIPINIMNMILSNEKQIFKVKKPNLKILNNKNFVIDKEAPYENEYVYVDNSYNNKFLLENNVYDNKKDDLKYVDSLLLVKELLICINNSKSISKSKKRKAREIVRQLIDNPKYKQVIEDTDFNLEFYENYTKLIKELMKILGLEENEKSIKHIAIYNYLQMYLSNSLDTEDEIQKRKMQYLRTSKLKCKFITTTEGRSNNPDYQIIRAVRYIVKQYKKRLLQCKNNPNTNSFIEVLVDFHNASMQLFDLIETRNVEIIKKVRNSIDHGHVSFDGDNIVLTDTNDMVTPTFECTCTSDDLFYTVNELDTKELDELQYDELSILCMELEPIFQTEEEKKLYRDFYEAVRFYYRNRLIMQLKEIKRKK